MDRIDYLLTRGVDKVYPSFEALAEVLRSGKKLRLYQGFDPTGTQLHIGHAVAMRKLRQFQNLGHHVIFLIGDFTGMIGDPSGKYSERKQLSREEVLQNAESYKEQAAKILRFDGENPVEIKYNSEWLGTMSAIDFLRLSHELSYQQVVERDMFQERLKKGQDVFMNEFLYPVLQAYDSVAMNVDLELGGSDQMFNMMMGRKLMRKMKGKEKFVMTVPLLADSKGVKIGKTEGNVIALTDPPNDFYAKIMSLGDDAIMPCLTLLTDTPEDELKATREAMKRGDNPMMFKKHLAHRLTSDLNGSKAGDEAQKQFELRTQSGKLVEADLPTIAHTTFLGEGSIVDQLVAAHLIESRSEAKRLVEQHAIDLNEQEVADPKRMISVKPGDILKIGKKKIIKVV